jgi:Ca-activated chloride channel family protein
VEVVSDDYVLVKVRYKAVDASTEDPAKEFSSRLKTLATQLEAADADLRWAVAMAAFAEILKGSPFAERSYLEQIGLIFAEQRERDADRAEFYRLFQLTLPKLGEESGS